jgi:glycosyltransferase involved in cell wall biosynthesis
MPERVLVVVQRYGDVAGGAETHARELVNRLKAHYAIEVATTTAKDYWTWEHAFIAGTDKVDGVPVHRFPVLRPRRQPFRRYERAAFAPAHTLADEWAFIDAQGPYAPELLDHIHRHGRDYDVVLFFTYIYYPTVRGVPLVPERAVVVPTAHDEPAIALAAYRPVFHAPRALAYNTIEERDLVHRRFGNQRVSHEVVGVGIDVPADASAERFRVRHGIDGPFFLYVGRIVESKGCPELFDHWARFRAAYPGGATLVLVGHPEMAIPASPDIRHLGRLDDAEKFDAFAACTAYVHPSRLESLSLVTLEAWAMGRPTICSARSPVLAGMTRRAGAGLPYGSAAEFAELLGLLLERPSLAQRLGANGRAFVERTYTWPVVVEKYRDLFAEVTARNAQPRDRPTRG